ncbi:MAG: hypothetical protein J6B10_02400 [Lachnospiraceae bacterium]|nr:hypothetical protein [Lachnospiraceae bacterium]
MITSWNPYIQYDEAYTLALIQHKWSDVVRITALDVHPPFYYLLVKLFTLPFQGNMWAVRAFNLLPLMGMFFNGYWIVRRLWGEQTGLWFSFLSVFLPANMTYLLPEMRMYGLASHLVVSTYLMGCILTKERWDILSEKKTWCLFWIFGILAAYTQYYALIAVALVYIWMAAAMLFRARALRESFLWGARCRAWCISVVCSILVYFPWLLVLLRQFGEVKEDYWIPPITIANGLSYVLFPIYSFMPVVAGLLLAGIVFLLVVLELINVRKKEAAERKDWKTIGSGLFVYIGMIAVGVVVSVTIRPVFSVRYVKCGLGILVLCLSCFFANMARKKQLVLLVVLGLFALVNLTVSVGKSVKNFKAYEAMQAYAEEHFDQNTVLAFEEDGHYMGIFSHWFRKYPCVIPDEHWKDEYQAFSPALMMRSDYEREYGSLREKEFWTVDIGNVCLYHEWNRETWQYLEHSEPFVFCDQTEQLQCVFTHLSGASQ